MLLKVLQLLTYIYIFPSYAMDLPYRLWAEHATQFSDIDFIHHSIVQTQRIQNLFFPGIFSKDSKFISSNSNLQC